MCEELLLQVSLSLLPGIGPITVRQLISYCGSVENVFKINLKQLEAVPGVGPKTAQLIVSNNNLQPARMQLAAAKKAGVSIHFLTDKNFPVRLKGLDNAPILLYTKGKPAYNHHRTIGIVGTRRATDYGKRVIRRILSKLKDYHPTIISGLAYGIDIYAHRESIKLGLPTIGVLANGMDHIYPQGHKKTADEMLSNGGLVTELKFGTKPEMFYFPARNRIIAGLSDLLVVVEARKKGGALITLDYMRKYKRPCLAVPGPIDAAASIGCNQMIRENKAGLLLEGNDIVKILGWDQHLPNKPVAPNMNSNEHKIITVLSDNQQGIHIDQLCWKTQITINKMGVHLLNLEFRGIVRSLPGKKFSLVGK